jgi:uncharacterized protein
MASTVCHVEYPSEDLEVSRKFAEGLFGWEFRPFGDRMMVFSTAAGHIGGFMKGSKPAARMCPGVSYIVDDLDASLEKAQALGGRIGDEKHPVPGVGYYASVIAPDGNEFGMVQFTEQG